MVSHHFTLTLASYLVSIPMEVNGIEGLKRVCPESWCSAGASCSPMYSPGSPISVSPSFSKPCLLRKSPNKEKTPKSSSTLLELLQFPSLLLPGTQVPSLALIIWPHVSTNLVCGRHAITPYLHSIKLSCAAWGVQDFSGLSETWDWWNHLGVALFNISVVILFHFREETYYGGRG